MSAPRLASLALAACAVFCLACASASLPDVAGRAPGLSRVDPELRSDPAVQAASDEVEAAIAREQGETEIDELQIRLRNQWEDGSRLRVATRLPVPNPSELAARRDVRRAQTETALKRLDETVLERRTDQCFRSVDSLVQQAHSQIYEHYAARQRTLLERSQARFRSGAISEPVATRLDLETRVRLASRDPGPALEPAPMPNVLPAVEPVATRLSLDRARLRELIEERHPSVAVHEAVTQHYQALGERARARSRPWLDFVELSYGPDTSARVDSEFIAQMALRIPFGAETGANEARYHALERGETRAQRVLVDEQVRRGHVALLELDHFESQVERWAGLAALGDETEALAERWEGEGIATPSDLVDLLDEALSARLAVLRARERAGSAACTLMAMTGVSLDEWPRVQP